MKNIQEELQVKNIIVTSFIGKEAKNSEDHKKAC